MNDEVSKKYLLNKLNSQYISQRLIFIRGTNCRFPA